MSHGHIRRDGFDRGRRQHPPALAVRPPKVEHRERYVVIVAAEVAHRTIAEFPPAIPARPRKIRRMEGPRRRGAGPEIPVHIRRDRHLFFETIHDREAVVKPVGLVEFFGRRGILESPSAICPDVNLAHRADDPGVQDFLDRAPHGRGVTLIAHLRGELRKLRGRLTDKARLPDIVGERLLAIHVLALRECEPRGEHVRVLRRGNDDGVKIVRTVEDPPEISERLRPRVTLRRRVDGDLVDIAEHCDVFVGMRARRRLRDRSLASLLTSGERAAPRHDRELVQARIAAATTGDERDVQLAVEILAAEESRRSGDDSGSGEGPADKLAPRQRLG